MKTKYYDLSKFKRLDRVVRIAVKTLKNHGVIVFPTETVYGLACDLKNKKAVEEINRHRWIESEKAGHDIGFEKASTQWLEEFSKAWMQYHMPKRKKSFSAPSKSISVKKSSSRKTSSRTTGRAKSKTKRS